MSASEDEYDAQLGGAITLSAEDCAEIDVLCTTASEALGSRASRATHIDLEFELETPQTYTTICPDVEKRIATRIPVTSPFQRYRSRGRLSVTDLVAPTWCEVQFEYGLQQHRSKRLEKRPESFITREGKKIWVEKKTAQLNDIVLREGHAVHTALEREIHPKQISVKIKTLEDEWGLRLINMLSDVQTLMLIGKCREFPVMGFIHDHLVIGIIDEINRVPLASDERRSESRKRPADTSAPSTPQKSKSQRSDNTDVSSPAGQLKLSSFFLITPKNLGCTPALDNDHATVSSPCIPEGQAPPKISDPGEKRTHTLYLVDSKTRLSASLPRHSATLSSRLQLMLYKRLLDALVSCSSSFDFTRLWKHIGLDPHRNFSEMFLEEVSLLDVFDKSEISCLKDLEARWWNAVRRLGVNGCEEQGGDTINPPVNDQLTLVYHLRAAGPSLRGKRKDRSCLVLSSSEDQELQTALKESLRHTAGADPKDICGSKMQHNTFINQVTRTPEHDEGSAVSTDEHPRVVEDSDPSVILDLQLDWAIQESLGEVASANALEDTASAALSADHPIEQASIEPPIPLQPSDIIGQKQFKHNDTTLDAHLADVLQWWHGVREPRGVAVEDSSRCHTCEYMVGCEWREKKALEALEQGKAKGEE